MKSFVCDDIHVSCAWTLITAVVVSIINVKRVILFQHFFSKRASIHIPWQVLVDYRGFRKSFYKHDNNDDQNNDGYDNGDTTTIWTLKSPLSTALRGAGEAQDTKFGVLSYATGLVGSRGAAQDPEFWVQTRRDSAAPKGIRFVVSRPTEIRWFTWWLL